MQNFRNLLVWLKAHQLTLDVYAATSSFPKHEIYGITSQLRRSTSSVPTNISEGAGKQTDKDFKRYLGIAFGSACETEYLLFLSFELAYLPETKYRELELKAIEVKKMLIGLMETLK